MIHAALLSFGMSGQVFHAPFINLHPGFKLLGSWERSTKRIQKKYPSTKSYNSLEEVLGDDQVDLVVVNTPTYTHYEYAKKALEAGKHIIVEKAFTTNAKEAMELRDLAKSRGLKAAVFQNRRWDSDMKTVKSVMDQRLLGEIIEASIDFPRYKPELSPKEHKEIAGPGAGIIKDLGAHVIDQAYYLFGMPEAVFGDIRVTRPGSEVDDYFDILLKYKDKSVHARGGYFFREPTPAFAFHGTLGSFLKSRADVQEDQLKEGMLPDDPSYGLEPETEEGLLHTETDGKEIREKIRTLKGDYRDYYEAIYQSITNDQPEPVTPEEGINVMQIIDAAFESHEKQILIKF